MISAVRFFDLPTNNYGTYLIAVDPILIQVILIGALAMAASAPTYQMPAYVINVDEAGGRHVQMGEPGKAVSGYFT